MSAVREVLIGDDDRLFADPLVSLLRERGCVADAAHDLPSARDALAARPTARCFLDRHFDGSDLLAQLDELVATFPATAFVVVDAHWQRAAETAALARGAAGLVAKDDDLCSLVLAAVTPCVVDLHAAARRIRRPAGVAPGRMDLTYREVEVLERLAAGIDAHELARELGISYTTVRTHIQHILWKLDVHSQVAAVARARSRGLVTPGARGAQTTQFAQLA